MNLSGSDLRISANLSLERRTVSPRRLRQWLQRFVMLAMVCAGGASLEAAGEYRTTEAEGLRITFDSSWASRTAPGYLPVRFDITNLADARVIEIVGQGSRFFRGIRGSGPGSLTVRQTVKLARGDRVRLTLTVPIFAENENIRFEVKEAGRTIEGFNYTGFQSGIPATSASALLVADSDTAFGKAAAGWPRPASPTGTMRMVMPPRSAGSVMAMPPLDFVLPPERLPANWLGFTSLRAVVIGPSEWGRLNEDQKSGLLKWIACGGDLVFVDGELNTILPGVQDPRAAADPRGVRAYFFGRIHLLDSGAISSAGLASVLTAAEKMQDSNFALPANRATDWGLIAGRGFRLLIPGVAGVPARAYITILIVFSLLIGPVNYWVLWRKQRQVLFVLTAPVISGLFILVLAGYVVAGEGLRISGRAYTFTILDEVKKQAVTRASASLYAAGMSPSGGLRFDRDVAVYPIGTDGKGSRDRQILDLSDAQRFEAGLIQARSPTNFDQVSSRTARERLSFSRQGGQLTVVNGLDATLKVLLYREGGQVYRLSTPLAPGAKEVMTDGRLRAVDFLPTDLPISGRLMHLVENQPERSYIAILDRSPFWQPGVQGIVERESVHFVIGWPAGQP